ncbi:hypothetical protein EAE99_006626 [Botrytis elliptica]|nr:hypothetical protein EAE99_006626 [Botrytis elliptica]
MRRGTALKLRQANGKPFLVDVPENRYHFVSTWDHIQEINAVHITSTTACFVLHDFCLRLEYIPLIRQEVESVGWESFDTSKGQGFPLLDSFMKESSRLNPVEAMSTRRVALKPFELSGGHQVPVGEWVCTAPGAMHHDSAYYAKSSEFHGFRFVEPSLYRNILEATNFEIPELGKSSEFVSVPDWQLWGTGRIAWALFRILGAEA